MIRTLEALALVGAISLSRLLPHLPNVTLTGPIALYAHERFGRFGIMIPLAGLAFSDILIGVYDWRVMVSVYISFALYVLIGRFVSYTSHLSTLAIASFAASTLFFFTTNTAVWVFSTWYPHSVSGLLACLAAGLPFYRNMLLADGVGTMLLFKRDAIISWARALTSPRADQREISCIDTESQTTNSAFQFRE